MSPAYIWCADCRYKDLYQESPTSKKKKEKQFKRQKKEKNKKI